MTKFGELFESPAIRRACPIEVFEEFLRRVAPWKLTREVLRLCCCSTGIRTQPDRNREYAPQSLAEFRGDADDLESRDLCARCVRPTIESHILMLPNRAGRAARA